MVAYLKRIDTGYAGDLTREPAPGDVVPEILEPTIDWSTYGFGLPVAYNAAGNIVPVTGTTTAAQVKGFLVRSFPGRAVSNTGKMAYPQVNGGATNVARRGSMAVPLQGSTTPVRGGAVYLRLKSPPTGGVVGGVEAAADGTAGNTILLANAQFEGPAGEDGITEITFDVF